VTAPISGALDTFEAVGKPTAYARPFAIASDTRKSRLSDIPRSPACKSSPPCKPFDQTTETALGEKTASAPTDFQGRYAWNSIQKSARASP